MWSVQLGHICWASISSAVNKHGTFCITLNSQTCFITMCCGEKKNHLDTACRVNRVSSMPEILSDFITNHIQMQSCYWAVLCIDLQHWHKLSNKPRHVKKEDKPQNKPDTSIYFYCIYHVFTQPVSTGNIMHLVSNKIRVPDHDNVYSL